MHFTKITRLKNEVAKVVIGHEEMIDAIIIALLCDGHILLESVPGLAKTTTIKTFASALDLNFKRVQFTPDLLPSDILGTEIYNQKTNEFYLKKGAVFTNLLLADEINRAPAKVQSALLEVMQEKQVTIGENSFEIKSPFLVLATQNPIEHLGAYALPEAQLDRFMLKIIVGYNSKEEELLIAKKISSHTSSTICKVLSTDELSSIKQDMQTVHIDNEVERYMIELIFATRFPNNYNLEEIAPYIEFGASPRGSIDLFKAVKAQAYIDGFDYVSPKTVAKIIKPILRHRIVLSYEAEAKNITVDTLLDTVLKVVPIP